MPKGHNERIERLEVAEMERLSNAVVHHARRVFGPDAQTFGIAMRDDPHGAECRAFWQRLEADTDARPTVEAIKALLAREGSTL